MLISVYLFVLEVIEVLKGQEGVCGLLCLEIATGTLQTFQCANVVLATGGPAGIYADSVYPGSQSGSTGLALRAGASLQNMTEWQYGLASTKPRWNVSGTYMQVLPRFVSVDDEGVEREFLADYFADPYEALSTVFLKGYQWPFDAKKVLNGSSVIDLLVYRETAILNRKVFLDYRANPFGLEQTAISENRQEATEALYDEKVRMSHLGGAIREKENMTVALNAVKKELAHFSERYMVTGADKLHGLYRLYDALTVQYVMLTALLNYAEVIKASRGSALYYDPTGDLREGLEEQFRLSVEADGYSAGLVQQVSLVEDECQVVWRKVRPLPEDQDFFENVWRQYRENRNIV